jgi:hypothetical protein
MYLYVDSETKMSDLSFTLQSETKINILCFSFDSLNQNKLLDIQFKCYQIIYRPPSHPASLIRVKSDEGMLGQSVEVTVAFFSPLAWNSPPGTELNHEGPQDGRCAGRYSNRVPIIC